MRGGHFCERDFDHIIREITPKVALQKNGIRVDDAGAIPEQLILVTDGMSVRISKGER